MRHELSLVPVLGVMMLAACAAPDAGQAVKPIAVSTLGLGSVSSPNIDATWWTSLGDPQLDRIMSDALSGSPRLDAALARVRQARSVLAARSAEDLPQIALDANEQRTRLSEKYTIPPPYGGSTRWVGQAEVNLGWNLDFWGRQADAIAQARASSRAADFDYAAARLALAGAVAQTYVELARAERQAAIGKANVEQRERSLKLVQTRIRSKLASDLDARATETVLAQARQALVRAEGQRVLLVHALALLAGQGAHYYATIMPTAIRLDAVLPLPSTLPADLLARRPDISSAQERIAAAAAGREVARKAFYPDINLQALVGVQAIGLGNLFSDDAVTYGAGPAVHLPIFQGGKLHAEHAGATARLDEAVADYNDAILTAVREAADALAQIESSRRDLAQQQQALTGLSEMTRLNRVRVAAGLDSRLDIIGADIRLLQAQQDEANLQAQAAIHAIQLLVAIGGGFDPAANVLETTSVPARTTP